MRELSGAAPIASESDLLSSRRAVRVIATDLGFRLTDVTRIVTAASELARNILRHGGGEGTMQWQVLDAPRRGLELCFEDRGPGIGDVDKALQEGFTTSPEASLGMGLPGTKRLMDEMEIASSAHGTKITVRKWLSGFRP